MIFFLANVAACCAGIIVAAGIVIPPGIVIPAGIVFPLRRESASSNVYRKPDRPGPSLLQLWRVVVAFELQLLLLLLLLLLRLPSMQ